MADLLGSAAQLFDARSWLAVLLNATLKGGLILALAFAALHCCRRSSASVRHWIGATAIVTLLALPVFSALLPRWDVPLLSRPTLLDSTRHSAPGAETLLQPTPVPRAVPTLAVRPNSPPKPYLRTDDASLQSRSAAPPEALTTAGHAVSDPQSGSIWPTASRWAEQWPLTALLLWLGGAGLLLLRLLTAMFYVNWLVRGSCLTPEPRWQRTARQMAQRMGIRRNVQLLFSPRLHVALSVGLWRPVVVLPAAAQSWSAAHLRSILLHELAHVRRWDNAVNIASQLVCTLYWFNPLVWRLSRQVTVDRELACDDAVLQEGTRASEYAGHLLEVAGAFLPGRRSLWRPVEVSQASALKDRLHAILDRKLSRAPLGRNAFACSALAALLLVPLAAFRPWVDPALSLSASSLGDGDGAKKRGGSQDVPAGDATFKPAAFLTVSVAQVAGKQEGRTVQPSVSRTALDAGGPVPRTIPAKLRQPLQRRPSSPRLGSEAAEYESLFGRPVQPTGLPEAGPQLRPRGTLPTSRPTAPSAGDGTSEGNGNPGRGGEDDGASLPGRVLDRRDDPTTDGETPQDPQDPSQPEPEPQPAAKTLVRRSLGSLGGSFSQGLAMNASGQVTGVSTTPSGEMRPFLWDPENGMTDLGTLGGYGGEFCGLGCWEDSQTLAVDINGNGDVIGISTTAEGQIRGFIWNRQEGMSSIGTLGGRLSVAVDINEVGQVAGYSTTADGRRRAILWSRRDGMVDLGGPSEMDSEAAAINDFGQVVGTIGGHAFLWDPEQGMHLVAGDGMFSEAFAVNNSGQVAGHASFVRGRTMAFLWDPDEGIRPLGTLGEEFQYSSAVSINEAGEVMGSSTAVRDLSLGDIEIRTFFWSHQTGMLDVESFAQNPVFNNQGQIAGRRSQDPESRSIRGFLWSLEEGIAELGDTEQQFDLSWPTALNDSGEITGVSLPDNASAEVDRYEAVIWQFVAEEPSEVLAPIADAPRQPEIVVPENLPSRRPDTPFKSN